MCTCRVQPANMLPLRVGCILLGSCVAGHRASGGVPAFSHFADTFSFPVSASPAPTDPESAIVRREPLSCGFFFYLIFTNHLPVFVQNRTRSRRYRPVTGVTSRRGSAPHAPILGFRARPRPRPQLGLGLAFCTGCIVSLYHPAVLSVSLSLSAIGARCMGRRRARTREYADDRGVNVQMIGVRRRGGTSGGSGRHSNCRRGDEDSMWTQWALRTSA